MKRLLGSIALAAALGFGAGGAYALDEDFWDDNWASDAYGYYDEDFEWEADEGFDDWYAAADDDWDLFYDDVGDEGLFDV